MFIVLPFPVSFKFSAWLWSAYPWNTSCCRATQTPHEHSLSAPLSPLLAESLYRWKYCFLPIAKKGPSLPPWQIFCVCSNAKPKPHTFQLDLTISLQNLEPFRGYTLIVQNADCSNEGCIPGSCEDRHSGGFLGFLPSWIHTEFGIMSLWRFEKLLSVNFSHFPYDRTRCCFCKSKIWAQQMVSIRKWFLCQLLNHMGPKLPFKSSERLF